MPKHAASWTDPEHPELNLFLLESPKRASKVFYRIRISGHPRIEGLLAREFENTGEDTASLSRPIPYGGFSEFGPPQDILMAARRFYYETRDRVRRKKGVHPKRTPTVARMCDEYLKRLEEHVQLGLATKSKLAHAKSFHNRYVAHYPPWETKLADEVTSDDMRAWQSWRDTYWTLGPGKDVTHIHYERGGKKLKRPVRANERTPPTMSHKNGEWVTFKAAFMFAVENRWMSEDQIPVHRFRKGGGLFSPPKKTPVFSEDDWNHLVETAAGWLFPEKLTGDNRHIRRLCWWFVMLCRGYGLRVAEAYSLKFGSIVEDVEDDEVVALLDIKSVKRGVKARRVGPVHAYREEMSRLLLRDLPGHYEMDFDFRPSPSDSLWMNADRSPIASFEGSFESLLKQAETTVDVYGNKYILTSIRHTAITREIEETDLSPYNLATWFGTSVKMIEEHYNHALVNRARRQERERRQRLAEARERAAKEKDKETV